MNAEPTPAPKPRTLTTRRIGALMLALGLIDANR
jgi:hypothetical protein